MHDPLCRQPLRATHTSRLLVPAWSSLPVFFGYTNPYNRYNRADAERRSNWVTSLQVDYWESYYTLTIGPEATFEEANIPERPEGGGDAPQEHTQRAGQGAKVQDPRRGRPSGGGRTKGKLKK